MMNIEILYEDRDIIVCVKPHGVPSQSDRSSAMDMISWIKNHLAAESGKKGGFYVGAVHRLDRPVAGVMVYAKTKKAAEEQYDVLFLDEAVYAIGAGLLDESLILEFLKNKPPHLEVILTGQGPSKALIDAADYVSEIKKLKHPFDHGMSARKGIER